MIRRFLGRKEEGKEEFLLGEDLLTSRGAIKVTSGHQQAPFITKGTVFRISAHTALEASRVRFWDS
jgi:hypothetical protein